MQSNQSSNPNANNVSITKPNKSNLIPSNSNTKFDNNKITLSNPPRKEQVIIDSSKNSTPAFDDYFSHSNFTFNLAKKHKCICSKDTAVI